LTYHQASDDVDSWSWDSQHIYFSSGRHNRIAGYQVSVDGGTPSRLFDHYFNTVHNLAEHPQSGEIFFNESWESKRFDNRKRYKGDYNPDIKSYKKQTGEYKEYTDYRGKDFGVSIDRNGNIYFMSDEANGEYNLYTFDNGQKRQLTDFNTSVYWPKVNADGGKVVFRKDYQIYVYDVQSGTTSKPEISLYRNYTLDKLMDHNVKGKISAFDISPDNKKLVFVSRGRMFVSDTKAKFIREIQTPSEEAVGEVYWLKDNISILFSMSDGGYYNWYSLRADGEGSIEKHTEDDQTNRALSMNSDRSQAAYISGRNEVRLMDLSTMKSKTIAEEELWGFNNTSPKFSPDDRYIAFNAIRNFESDVFIYDIEEGEKMNLTQTGVSESDPVWSPDGKYLYLSTDPLNPSYPYGTENAHIYRLPLQKYSEPFKSERLDKLLEEDKDENGDDSGKDEESTEDKKEDVQVKIAADIIMERMEAIGPAFGQQRAPELIESGDKLIVMYLSNHEGGTPELWKTTMEPFEAPKHEKVGDQRVFGYSLRSAKDNYYLLSGGTLHSLNPGNGKMEKIDVSHTFRKNLNDEFVQMYYEAWAGMEENFYDQDFHGEDWTALRDSYVEYLPFISSRAELRLIFNDMLGELNTSHIGFRSTGDEEETLYDFNTVSSGILFSADDPYVVQHVVTDGPADVADLDIQPGDRLVAINGNDVDPEKNREFYFYLPSGEEEVALTLERGGERLVKRIHPVSAGAMQNLLYDEWQDANQKYVDEKTEKRIAYVHMKNMGRGEYNSFVEDMVREGAYRDGLILDLRYNTGGNVHDDVLEFLGRKKYLEWKYREGKKTSQPNFHPSDKPIVLLVNEQSLYDAVMTAAGFKELGLGTIIGTETYRWIIFTSGKGLVDGSFYRLPSWGCYTLDGKDLESTGVSPDIRVEKNFKERLNGEHPQLDRAIDHIMSELSN
ncbi:MAG: S41 family peptidase, partial [Cyclobacteriaceae bacterium]